MEKVEYFAKLIEQGYKYALFTYADSTTPYLLTLEGAYMIGDNCLCAKWKLPDGFTVHSGGFPWNNCQSFKALKSKPKSFK